MVVNQDYKNWHIAYYCHKAIIEIQDYPEYTIGIIHDDNNKYIEKIIETNSNIKFISNLMQLPSADYYVICCHLDKKDYQKIVSSNGIIIDAYKTYLSYELSKISQNYIVDEYRESDDYYEKYICQKDVLATDYIQHYIKNCYTENGKLKLFNKIEIETINRCNNTCGFCPVNRNVDKRPFKIMGDIFNKIIEQLAELQYKGAVGLFSNNEPLMDKEIINRCKLAREKLPNAYLYIYTNGILLNEKSLSELLKYLDYIYIDNYNENRELLSSLKPIYKYLIKNYINPDKISIHLRNQNEILSTRAGNAPNKNIPISIKSRCILPFSQMIIQANGKVCLCSNDALGQVTLGDVATQSLLDIWYGEEYEKVRNLIQQGREMLNICSVCDAIFTPLPFERRNDE